MYLKSLTLKGFKSFANSTRMVFDPGLSVVMGPNGSGKSNISDAVLWVLGTQSARQLRGQAMEDVIFSGSATRSKVALAEVTLVLDNSDRTLSLDVSEVSIVRRLYRSGENEYLINGAPARLMDVQDILHDSGLGKETHSIISQGKLDSVLNSKPEERRALIEEAAGISKHRRRKERAEKKLGKLDENVKHLKTLLRETNRRLKPLEGQVDKAATAAELKSEAQSLALAICVTELKAYQAQWEGLEQSTAENSALVTLYEEEAKDAKAHLEKVTAILEEKGLFAGDIEASQNRLSKQQDALKACMRLLEEKGRSMVERLSDARRTLSSLSRDKAEAQSSLEKLASGLATTKGEAEGLQREEQALRSRMDELEKEAANQQTKLEELEAEAQETTRALDARRIEHSKLISSKEVLEKSNALYTERKEGLVAREKEAKDQVSLAKHKLKEAKVAHEVALANAEEADKAAHSAEEAKHLAQEAFDALYLEKAQKEADVKAVKAMVEAHNTDAPQELEAPKLIAHIPVPKTHAGAFDAFFAELQEAYVVASTSELAHAENVVAFVTDLAKALPNKPKGLNAPSLADAIDTAQLDPAVVKLLKGVFVVETLEEATQAHAKHPTFTFVTTGGALLSPTGVVRTGSTSSSLEGHFTLLERKHELAKELAHIQKRMQASETKLAQAKENLAKAQDEKEREQNTAQEASKSLMEAQNAFDQTSQSVLNIKSQIETLDKSFSEDAKDIQSLTEELNHVQTQLKELEAAQAKHNKALAEAQRNLTSAKADVAKAEAKVSEVKLKSAGISERIRYFETRAKETDIQLNNIKERETAFRDSSRALEVMRLRIEPLFALFTQLLDSHASWQTRVAEQIHANKTDSATHAETLAKHKRELADARQKLESAKEQAQELSLARAKLEVTVEHAVEQVKAHTQLPLEEALLTQTVDNLDQAREHLAKLAKELEHIGPVNEIAAEEFEELKSRQVTIEQALEELKSAKRAVDQVMRAIDSKMKQAFIDTFHAVNKNFQEVFCLLFPGGTAHLELTDEADVQETGLEIMAQPRGKRIPKLALLSGGEKSLCALAFLFAVYKTRTVPFYIFDEVEAALDDANLSKLLTAIDELKKTTQLIVITHQRATMEQADVLWGVSMGTDGVSQVLSQRLSKTAQKEE